MKLINTFGATKIEKLLIVTCILLTPDITLGSSHDGKAMEGMELYKNKNFVQASQKFLEAYQEKPNDLKISYNLGNSHYKHGKFEKALKDYSRLLDNKVDQGMKQKSIYNMGNTLFRMNKLEESVAAYKKAIELDPNDMDAKFNLEFALEQIKKKNKKQQKQTKSDNGKNKQQLNEQKNQNNVTNSPNQKTLPLKNMNEQRNPQNDVSPLPKALQKSISKEEATRKLSSLSEDLKKFQRKQARDIESIFTYHGNDW